jgi:hypothetical protein
MALQPLWTLAPLFQFLNLYTVGRTPCTGAQPVARPLPIHRTTQTQNKRTQTFMPKVDFEPTIPVFERAKTVHALDRAATVIGLFSVYFTYIKKKIRNQLTRSPCYASVSPNVARKRLGRRASAAKNTHVAIEELLDAVFYVRSVSYKIRYSVCRERNVGGS